MFHGRGALLNERLEQLEARHMSVAVLLIKQGAIRDVISGRRDCLVGQVCGRLKRFQEEVEEITDALMEAQAKHRRVRSK